MYSTSIQYNTLECITQCLSVGRIGGMGSPHILMLLAGPQEDSKNI